VNTDLRAMDEPVDERDEVERGADWSIWDHSRHI